MRILVAIPSISLEMAMKSSALESFLSIEPFEQTDTNLDVFQKEMEGVSSDGLWTVNVPHWPLKETGTKGIAGPGKPIDELFYPTYLEKTMAPLCGKYDKWRPYPATKPLSNYSIDMATRFGKKRCRMFEAIADDMPWEALFYVEHGPASLVHLSKKAAMESAEMVIEKCTKVAARHPAYSLVIFSPYGVGSTHGFVVSNRMDAKMLSNWNEMRNYLNGHGTEGSPEVSTD